MAPSHEDRVKSLKAKREAFSIELQELKDMLNDPEVFAHGRDLPYREISMRLEDIQSEYAAFAKNQQDLDTADETGDLLRERMKLKSLYTQVRAQALDFLPSNNVASTATHAPHGDAQNHPSPYSQLELLDLDVQLPKINLPTFSGQYEEWPGFADQFRSTVHENQRINDGKKLMYLRSCLKNEALRAIESLSNSASNYAVAWNILQKRYHQPAIIVTNHLKALFDTATVNRSTHRELRPFLNSVEAHYRSLQSLKQPTTDSLLIHLLLSKIDKDTVLKWKEHTCNEQFPTIETFFAFLHERCQILEPLGNPNNCQTSSIPNYTPRQQPFRRPPPRPFVHNAHTHTSQVFNVQTPTISCNFCKGSHYPQQCETFLRLSIPDRIKFAKTKSSCLNCLRPTHRTSECRSTTCRRCYQKHHTLLHQEVASTSVAPTQVNATCLKASTPSQILLSTAVINVMDKFGQPHPCRVLLDSCSQSHFITKKFFQRLQLDTKSISIPINGMNDMNSVVKAQTTAQIQSRYNNFSRTLSMLIVDEISQRLPVHQIEKNSLNIPENTYLADPQFYEPAGIDGLLGAQVFWDLLCLGQITLNEKTMKLQQTQLGWIITGEVPIKSTRKNTIGNLSMEALNSNTNKFWELEERVPEKLLSIEASKILKTDFRVNDLLTGADDLGKAQRIRDDLIALTAKGGFQLRQWLSNEPRLVAPLQKSDDPLMTLDLSDEKRTLGPYWHPAQDTLGYTLKSGEPLNTITRRTILSRIAQLFNPLGLIGPIIVQAKLIMQSLRKTKQTWKAAVKSLKHHLVRVLGNTLLTYEAFNTCIIEIEAILNSRPITPLSSDPTDYTALTPGHFLIGDAMTNLPERDFSAVNTGRLALWQHLQQIKQHFWARWHKEYWNELTIRQKWHRVNEADIQEGLLVIIKKDNLPSFHWPLGRILEKHPGKDGITRVVTIKTASGIYKRPLKKLAPLPIDTT
ncbi:hypothetical protein ANTRET_LOCUS5477 [Anthophora retusa]